MAPGRGGLAQRRPGPDSGLADGSLDGGCLVQGGKLFSGTDQYRPTHFPRRGQLNWDSSLARYSWPQRQGCLSAGALLNCAGVDPCSLRGVNPNLKRSLW